MITMEILSFFSKTKASFRRVRKEMTDLRNSLNEWIVFLNSNQKQMQQRIDQLDQRVRELEMERISERIRLNSK
ncbi:MAG: hypothetical protein R6U32_03665 [Candidatus Woesearchaeota archaeon]